MAYPLYFVIMKKFLVFENLWSYHQWRNSGYTKKKHMVLIVLPSKRIYVKIL